MASFSQKITGLVWHRGLLASLLLLASCGNLELPHIWGSSEVPEAVLAQPRVVTTRQDGEKHQGSWPRLGDTPKKVPGFSSPSALEAERELLRAMREETRIGQENVQ